MDRWQNQEEAFQFAMTHSACMLDMDMGTGKTRVAIDVAFERTDVHKILVVCPKAVISVWRENLLKFRSEDDWTCWDRKTGSVNAKTEDLRSWMQCTTENEEKTGVKQKIFVVINYDAVWRGAMGDLVVKTGFDLVILDESHRAKAAGSKVSRYLALLGKRVKYRMCLSGTPMANSPLDVYGQYRFLDPEIFGTRHDFFLQEFAIMGGPDRNFIVGYKNQNRLNAKFNSIAYHCKMADIADKIKLPAKLPPTCRLVTLPNRDLKTMKELSKEFVAECSSGHIVVSNVLTKLLRLQQMCSGFCVVGDGIMEEKATRDMNTAKEDELCDILEDVSITENVVVFCIFRHDLESIRRVCKKCGRQYFELSGSENTLDEWKKEDGAVIGVQIQAGAEGVDMTKANRAIYYSLPHSLAMYNQSKARLYRPNQTRPVSFIHLIAENTVDVAMYRSLLKKEDIIEAIKQGSFDIGYMY